MGDSFQGVQNITLQPADATVPYTFTVEACSSATANDGSIPFGTLLSTVVVTAFDENGNDVTSEMISSETNTNTVMTINLKYPATTGVGRYSLEMVATLDSGAIMEFDFTRIYAEDITA